MVKAIYYPVSGSGGANGGGTIQTIVKVGVLKSLYQQDPENGDGSAPVLWSTALFVDGIPNNYELFYNGQWYNKGQLGEIKLNTTTLRFPNLEWTRTAWSITDILELKYQIVI
jgi:hypothetical protein